LPRRTWRLASKPFGRDGVNGRDLPYSPLDETFDAKIPIFQKEFANCGKRAPIRFRR
jgi:hypothetical protein